MAQVVHELWASSDKSVLIMPSSEYGISRVQPELTKYLGSEWSAILANDIDGEQSIPYQVDNNQPNLGKVHASRRVARALFMGTAPLANIWFRNGRQTNLLRRRSARRETKFIWRCTSPTTKPFHHALRFRALLVLHCT